MRTRIRIAPYGGGQTFCVQVRRFWGWEMCMYDEYYDDICAQTEGQAVLFNTYDEARNWALMIFKGFGLLEL